MSKVLLVKPQLNKSTILLNEKKENVKPTFIRRKSSATHFNVNSKKIDVAPTSHRRNDTRSQLKEIGASHNHSVLLHALEPLHHKELTSLEKEKANLINDYGVQIDRYLKNIQETNGKCLTNHEVTPALRAKMADWMIEVLTNFKSEDQTYFLSLGLMDRYFKEKKETIPVSQLHILGVACMFIASKFEDIYPLKMNMVYEKITHKKLSPEVIKAQEHEILTTLQYRIASPTSYEFLTSYMTKIFHKNDDNSGDIELLEKMAIYLTKMSLHDYALCQDKPSLQAAGSLYVALKICEQLKKKQMIDVSIVRAISTESSHSEDEIIDCAQKILHNAQNFDKLFPGLENLKKTHFVNLSSYLQS